MGSAWWSGGGTPCATANEDAPSRRSPQASKGAASRKGRQGIREAPNGPKITRPLPSLAPPPRLWPLPLGMPSSWQPAIRRGDDAVRPIADVPRGLPRRQDDSKKGELGTGWGIIASACIV